MKLILLLAALINSECSICNEDEQLMTGSVVMNRMYKYKKDMHTIVYQKAQFHGVLSRNFKPTNETIKVAAKLIMHGPIDSTVTHFYLRNSPSKPYRSKLKVIYKLKFHNFCL